MFGSWNHRPNRIAVQWFADYVWPAVRSEVPDARLQLLGPHHPPISVTSVAGIHVVGRVPSLAEALGQASVVIVPIREGVGTRVKFVESRERHCRRSDYRRSRRLRSRRSVPASGRR